MHAWEGRPFADIARLPLKRDPRRYPVGCATGDGVREAVQWFRNIPELAQFLRRMEPQRWGLAGPELIDCKAALEPALTQVDVLGLTEANRRAHNAVTAPRYRILWWGTLEALLAAPEDWPRGLLRRAEAIDSHREEAIERLRAYLRARAQEW